MMLYGKRVIVSPLLPMLVPARQLEPRHWHAWRRGEQCGYAARVNKKWRKRYGMKPSDIIIMIGDTMLVSAATIKAARDGSDRGGDER